jgi:hypothetical protein
MNTLRGSRRAGSLVAMVLALALGAAACGSSGDDKTGQSGRPAAESSGSTQLVKFAQCMRQNGVTAFPDPVNGRFSLQVTRGGPLDPRSPQFQSARQACKTLEPPGLFQGGNANPARQNAMLKFASCMRQNGVRNFPDPRNGNLVITGGIDPNSPQFKSAMQACRKLLPGGTIGGGQ